MADESAHEFSPRRKTLGLAPISNRPLYGWDPGCTCGWRTKSNEDKAEARRRWREDHFNKVDLRTRLLRAGRHLTAVRFGWVISRLVTPGVDWQGCSKGHIIKTMGSYRHPDYQAIVEELEAALRDQENAAGLKAGDPAGVTPF